MEVFVITHFLKEADLDDIDVTIYTPYPGSLIYEDKEKFDITFKDDYGHAWYKGKPGFYRSLVSTSSLTSAEILKIRDELEVKYKKNANIPSSSKKGGKS